jgi:hypothetical protein
MNTNLNTRHSFSSSITNQNGTSNGSSFITHDNKTKGKFLGCQKGNYRSSVVTSEGFHANSVDFTNASPFRANHNNNLNKIITTNMANHAYSTYESDPNINLMTHPNYVNPYAYSFCLENNVYKNYLIDSGKGINFNTNSNSNKVNLPIPPVRFNPSEDKSVLDNLMILIKDQNGCRMIQKKLEERKEEFIKKFYEKIKPNICDIICDQFGNYVIQKFVDCCNDKTTIKNILLSLKQKIYTIFTNCYGTRGIQKIIEFVNEESEYNIIKEYTKGKVFNLIRDVNGNHVIQKILLVYPTNRSDHILEEIIESIEEISKLKQGGCIFQKAVDKADEEMKVFYFIYLV